MGSIVKQSPAVSNIELYTTIKEIGRVLGKDKTAEIIFLLSNEPMRNKQLKKVLKCNDNTLSRRLDKLQEYGVIDKLPVTLGNKKSHEYTITVLGQELIRFFRNYERKRYMSSGGR